jgi:hypothetical protein
MSVAELEQMIREAEIFEFRPHDEGLSTTNPSPSPTDPRGSVGPCLQMLAFTAEEILSPIAPERYLLPGVPADAYTVMAGALSSYKSRMLVYLLAWKATGWDILGLDERGAGIDVGKSVLLTYEDVDRRIFSLLQLVIQHGHQLICARWGTQAGREFVERAAANIRRVSLAGHSELGLVHRIAGTIVPNTAFLEQAQEQIARFAPGGALIGLDPLRLALAGSQSDDDGADIAVHVLNRLATAVPNSGVIVCSHTTKAGAQDMAEGYAGAAYATAGSALYSQHARSNFHMGRLRAEEIRTLFAGTVTAEQADRQQVARLTHGRDSHGLERNDIYLLMEGGTLTRIKPAEPKPLKQIMAEAVGPVIEAIDRIHADGLKVSRHALESDTALLKTLRNRSGVRSGLLLLLGNGLIQETGKTTNRDVVVTEAGRIFSSGESRRESSEP